MRKEEQVFRTGQAPHLVVTRTELFHDGNETFTEMTASVLPVSTAHPDIHPSAFLHQPSPPQWQQLSHHVHADGATSGAKLCQHSQLRCSDVLLSKWSGGIVLVQLMMRFLLRFTGNQGQTWDRQPQR